MFDTKELGLLHASVQSDRKRIAGGNWIKIEPDYHQQLLEEHEDYADLYNLEIKLEKIIRGEL